jgi:hypothetical protein
MSALNLQTEFDCLANSRHQLIQGPGLSMATVEVSHRANIPTITVALDDDGKFSFSDAGLVNLCHFILRQDISFDANDTRVDALRIMADRIMRRRAPDEGTAGIWSDPALAARRCKTLGF